MCRSDVPFADLSPSPEAASKNIVQHTLPRRQPQWRSTLRSQHHPIRPGSEARSAAECDRSPVFVSAVFLSDFLRVTIARRSPRLRTARRGNRYERGGIFEMNLQSPRGNDATQTSNRSKNVVPSSGLCSRCTDELQGQLRGLQVVVPRPRGDLPRPLRRGHRRRRQGLPDRLLPPQHPGLRAGRQGAARRRGGQPRQHALPDGEHRDRVRCREQGQDEGADLHRRARLDRDRPQELGALRRRRRHLRRHASSAARTSAASTPGWSWTRTARSPARPTWTAASRPTAATTRATATSSCR